MFRHRRLLETQAVRNVTDGTFLQSQIVQNVEPTRLGSGIEGIRCGRCARHENNIFLYKNMSSGTLSPGGLAEFRYRPDQPAKPRRHHVQSPSSGVQRKSETEWRPFRPSPQTPASSRGHAASLRSA